MGNRSLAVSGSNDNDLVSLISYIYISPSSLFLFPPPQWCPFLLPIWFFLLLPPVFIVLLLLMFNCYTFGGGGSGGGRLVVVVPSLLILCLRCVCVCVLCCAGATRADRLQMTTKGVVRIRIDICHRIQPLLLLLLSLPPPFLFPVIRRKREREREGACRREQTFGLAPERPSFIENSLRAWLTYLLPFLLPPTHQQQRPQPLFCVCWPFQTGPRNQKTGVA